MDCGSLDSSLTEIGKPEIGKLVGSYIEFDSSLFLGTNGLII